jgi:hypothetical protein
MTPQEKAQELVDKYYQLAESIEWTDEQTSVKAEKFNDELGSDVLKYWNELSKQSALIAVDEMLSNDGWSSSPKEWDIFKKYCKNVKQEIEKL